MKIPESTQSQISILLSIGLIAFVVEWNVIALVGGHSLETALGYALVYFLLPTAIIMPVLYFALLRPQREQYAALRDALRELTADLRPTADRLGCAEQLDQVEQVLEGGASYQVFQRKKQIVALLVGNFVEALIRVAAGQGQR